MPNRNRETENVDALFIIIIIIILGDNIELIQCISLFFACPFGVAGEARVGIYKHFDLLQLAAISQIEFQDATRPGF